MEPVIPAAVEPVCEPPGSRTVARCGVGCERVWWLVWGIKMLVFFLKKGWYFFLAKSVFCW